MHRRDNYLIFIHTVHIPIANNLVYLRAAVISANKEVSKFTININVSFDAL